MRACKPTMAVMVGRVSLLSKGIALLLEEAGYKIEYGVPHEGASQTENVENVLFIVFDESHTLDSLTGLVQDLKRSNPLSLVFVLYVREIGQEQLLGFGADGCIPLSIGPDSLVSALNLAVTERVQFAIVAKDDLPAGAKAKPHTLFHDTTHIISSDLDQGEIPDRLLRTPENISISNREQAVLQNLVRGDSNKVIARRLSISEATVKIHVRSLLRKIGAENRTQAAIRVLNEGIGEFAPMVTMEN